VSAVSTAFLFERGKSLIALYPSSGAVTSRYGAGLILVLLWIHDSAQIFLLGAEVTMVYAKHNGSMSETR
jgi:membrane protein